jgi:hypothetical protein
MTGYLARLAGARSAADARPRWISPFERSRPQMLAEPDVLRESNGGSPDGASANPVPFNPARSGPRIVTTAMPTSLSLIAEPRPPDVNAESPAAGDRGFREGTRLDSQATPEERAIKEARYPSASRRSDRPGSLLSSEAAGIEPAIGNSQPGPEPPHRRAEVEAEGSWTSEEPRARESDREPRGDQAAPGVLPEEAEAPIRPSRRQTPFRTTTMASHPEVIKHPSSVTPPKPAEQPPTSVVVSIGKVEVRASAAGMPAPRQRSRAAPMSLEEYLAHRSEERR